MFPAANEHDSLKLFTHIGYKINLRSTADISAVAVAELNTNDSFFFESPLDPYTGQRPDFVINGDYEFVQIGMFKNGIVSRRLWAAVKRISTNTLYISPELYINFIRDAVRADGKTVDEYTRNVLYDAQTGRIKNFHTWGAQSYIALTKLTKLYDKDGLHYANVYPSTDPLKQTVIGFDYNATYLGLQNKNYINLYIIQMIEVIDGVAQFTTTKPNTEIINPDYYKFGNTYFEYSDIPKTL